MQKSIKAAFMRGGTSKGVFFKKSDLEKYSSQVQKQIFLRAIGSPDPYKNHMDGMGSANSSTSKVAIISLSDRDDCDINYNFGAVSIGESKVDFSGNCGNLSSAAGVFAVENGLLKKDLHSDFKQKGEEVIEVQVYQENTKQKMVIKIDCINGFPKAEGDFYMAGLNNAGSQIDVSLLFQEGDNKEVLPTGNVVDQLEYQGIVCENKNKTIDATLVNVGNPTIFIRASDIEGLMGTELSLNSQDILKELEEIRCIGGYKMGLGKSPLEIHQFRPATPKISFLSEGGQDYKCSSGEVVSKDKFDFQARILSMGALHHAYTATGAMSLAAGTTIPGTICSEFYKQNREGEQEEGRVQFAHRSGVIDIKAQVSNDNEQKIWEITQVGYPLSARTLFRGEIMIPESAFVEPEQAKEQEKEGSQQE